MKKSLLFVALILITTACGRFDQGMVDYKDLTFQKVQWAEGDFYFAHPGAAKVDMAEKKLSYEDCEVHFGDGFSAQNHPWEHKVKKDAGVTYDAWYGTQNDLLASQAVVDVVFQGRSYSRTIATRPHLLIHTSTTTSLDVRRRIVIDGAGITTFAGGQCADATATLLDITSRGEPDWLAALRMPDVKLHLYGKAEARPGRKMGHLTALAATPEEAAAKVVAARAALVRGR